MFKLSRGALLAIAAAAAIPAGVALAKSGEPGWHRMSTETRARLNDGRIAMVKTALKLTPDQEKLWEPVEANIRDGFKAREARKAEFEKMREERRASRDSKADETGAEKAKRPDMIDRLEKMSNQATDRATKLKGFVDAFKPLYASFSEEQKSVVQPLIRQLSPFGGKGHGGQRWAERRHGGHHGYGGPNGWSKGPRGGDGDQKSGDTSAE